MAEAFHSSLVENEKGRLSDEQSAALTRMYRARRLVGWLLGIGGLLLAALEILAYVLPSETTPGEDTSVLWKVAIFFILIGAYGIAVLVSAKGSERRARAASVAMVRGIPTKSDYATPVRVPGPGGVSAMHFIRVKAGVVHINGQTYGVLPSTLYEEIADGVEANFYWVPSGGIGFKKRLIVNYFV